MRRQSLYASEPVRTHSQNNLHIHAFGTDVHSTWSGNEFLGVVAVFASARERGGACVPSSRTPMPLLSLRTSARAATFTAIGTVTRPTLIDYRSAWRRWVPSQGRPPWQAEICPPPAPD